MNGARRVRHRESALVQRIEAGSRRPKSLGTVPEGVISLAMGEPYAGTPQPVVAAAVRALAAGRTKYEPTTGSPSLRSALARHLSGRSVADIAPEAVVVTHGASAGLAAAALAVVNPGDRVVVPEPTYSLYADHIALAGGNVDWVPTTACGRLDLAAMDRAMAGATMVIVCNPGNPTGTVWPRQDLLSLGALAERHDCIVLIDEAYADIVFDDLHFSSGLDLPQFGERLIVCGTFSKSYAMTGWRLGWVTAEPGLADRINLVHRTINGPLNTFVQDAGLAALSTTDEEIDQLRAAYQARRDLVVEAVAGLSFVEMMTPQGAFYAFLRVHSDLSADELTSYLAQNGVLVRSGREYGPSGEGFIRVSFATQTDDLSEGLARLVSALRNLCR